MTNMKPRKGIDGPAWIYPGEVVYKKDMIEKFGWNGSKFICSTFESNSLSYGGGGEGDYALFRIHPDRYGPKLEKYERARTTGFTREQVILAGHQPDLF